MEEEEVGGRGPRDGCNIIFEADDFFLFFSPCTIGSGVSTEAHRSAAAGDVGEEVAPPPNLCDVVPKKWRAVVKGRLMIALSPSQSPPLSSSPLFGRPSPSVFTPNAFTCHATFLCAAPQFSLAGNDTRAREGVRMEREERRLTGGLVVGKVRGREWESAALDTGEGVDEVYVIKGAVPWPASPSAPASSSSAPPMSTSIPPSVGVEGGLKRALKLYYHIIHSCC